MFGPARQSERNMPLIDRSRKGSFHHDFLDFEVLSLVFSIPIRAFTKYTICTMTPEILGDIGCCIYCLSTENLSKEHIVPICFGGRWILENASCQQCGAITSAFEGHVAGKLWPSTRFLYGVQSKRRPKQRPPSFALKVTTVDGNEHSIELSPEKYGGVTPFIGFELPGHLTGKQTTGTVVSSHSLNRNGGLDFKDLAQEIGSAVASVELHTELKPSAFARMVAKIAYGFAIAQYGLNKIHDDSFVLPAILGLREDIGMWVGNSPRDTEDPLQDFGVEIFEEANEIRARVRFWGRLHGSMTYLVILSKTG